MTLRTGFCVSGNGSLFRAAVRRRAETGIEPLLAVLEAKASADLEPFCSEHAVRVVRLDPADRPRFDAELTSTLIDADLELIALTFDRVLPSPLVRHYRRRIINVHPSLLPAFIGMNALNRALEAGVRIGGVTIHEVVDEVDAGPIVAQAALATIPGESSGSYGKRMYALLEPMFLQVLRWFAEGRVEHDAGGRPVVRDARYGQLPIAPALEAFEVGG